MRKVESSRSLLPSLGRNGPSPFSTRLVLLVLSGLVRDPRGGVFWTLFVAVFYAEAFSLSSRLYLLVLPVGPEVTFPEMIPPTTTCVNTREIASSSFLVLLAV